jgi:UDP-N-acetyl-D-glucosamine dehydrogenase
MRLLNEKGAILSYNDPYVPTLRLNGETLTSVHLSPAAVATQDCLVILTDHSDYDFKNIIKSAKLVIDTRNVTKGLDEFKDRIIKLGAGNQPAANLHSDEGHSGASLSGEGPH